MTIYNLRDGLTIDLNWELAETKSCIPSELEFDKKSVGSGQLHCKTKHLNTDGTISFEENAVKLRAAGVVTGAPQETIMKCALRFIQLMTCRHFDVGYFGKRPSEGMVNWSYSGQILQRVVDAFVPRRPDGSFDLNQIEKPFQFPDKLVNQRVPPNRLAAQLGDSPQENLPLAEFNKESNTFNYLFSISLLHQFESIATFVHPDGSMQMLESRNWTYRRLTALQWAALEPKLRADQASVTLLPAVNVVFGKDADFAGTIKSDIVANVVVNEAFRNLKTSPNIRYEAVEKVQIFPHPDFWSP